VRLTPTIAAAEDPSAALTRQLLTLVRAMALVVTALMALQFITLPAIWWRNTFIVVAVNLICLCVHLVARRGHARLGARIFVGAHLALIAGLSWTAGGMHAPATITFIPMVLIAGILLGIRAGAATAAIAGFWLLWLVVADAAALLPTSQVQHTAGSLASVLLINLALIGVTLWLATEEVHRVRRAGQQASEEKATTEAALRESEQRLALALEASTDGIFDLNFATGAAYCSPRYFTMLGYAPDELTASLETWRSLLHPDDRAVAEAAMARYFANAAEQHSIETRLRAKNGSWRWMLSRGRITGRDATGAPLRLIGTHVDITERKEAEFALRQAKDFAEKLVATANALVVCLDPAGCIVVFNTTAEAVTGYTAAELAGADWFGTLVPRERHPQVWSEFARRGPEGIPEHFETAIRTKSGAEKIVVWRNGVLRDGPTVIGTISFGIDVTERRRAEQDLAKERDLVTRLVETSPSGIVVVDASGCIVFANSEAERILALRRLVPTGHQFAPPDWQLLNPDGTPVPESERTFRQVLATGRPVRGIRHLLRWTSGRHVLLSINAAPLLDPAGRTEGVVSTLEDITARQTADDLLRESEERLRSIVDHAPFGSHLYELTPDGRLLFQAANRSADSILHIDHGPLAGREILAAFPGLAGTDIPDTYRHVVTSGQPHHRALVRYDAGDISGAFDVHALPIGRSRVVVFFVDITERERAAAALRHSEEQYRRLFNCGNDALFVHGIQPDGQPGPFSQVNDIACQLLGYSRAELLTRGPADINDPACANRATAAIARLQREQHALFEMELVARDGHRLPVEINSRVFELDGRPAVLSVVRDVSERRRLEDQLRQAQKMEVFGQLAGGVAHDFNNLLVAIIGNAELLLESPAFEGRPREQLAQIQEAGRRAAALTRQLLLFARKQPSQPVACDLGTVVADHVKLLHRIIGEDIEFVLALTTETLPIMADVNMVEQVAMNLVVNARDAMPRGGRLTLRTARVALDETNAARCACPPGTYAALAVRDTGCGIPEAIRARIFEPFFTTKPSGQGTGLGLSTVLGIVQQHRGGLALESEEGRGTEFTIFLPIASPAANVPTTPTATAAAQPATPATILVVEDDAAVRTIIDRTLGKAGYRVLLASSAAEGIGQLERCAPQIDLVLSDVVMPGGIDGAQLAHIIASRWATIPVRLMSGYAKGLEGDAVQVLPKPFSTAQLLAFIHEGLARRRP
jgi:PAS domain S-box-containing protein